MINYDGYNLSPDRAPVILTLIFWLETENSRINTYLGSSLAFVNDVETKNVTRMCHFRLRTWALWVFFGRHTFDILFLNYDLASFDNLKC